MDLGTIIGISGTVAAILYGILSTGSVSSFIDVPSIFITFGGCLFATIMRFPFSVSVNALRVMPKVLFQVPRDPKRIISDIIVLSERARKESILSLERVAVEDVFLKKGIRMAVDGKDPATISSVMTIDLNSMVDRHHQGKAWLDSVGELGPGFGMVGTLVGLIIMLGNLNDPSSVGPSMAVALLTTFYGACISNMMALPLATKLEMKSKEERMVMNLIIVGVLGILAGENPRIIREKLESFLPPSERSGDDLDNMPQFKAA